MKKLILGCLLMVLGCAEEKVKPVLVDHVLSDCFELMQSFEPEERSYYLLLECISYKKENLQKKVDTLNSELKLLRDRDANIDRLEEQVMKCRHGKWIDPDEYERVMRLCRYYCEIQRGVFGICEMECGERSLE